MKLEDGVLKIRGWTVLAILPVHDHYDLEYYVLLGEHPNGDEWMTALYHPKTDPGNFEDGRYFTTHYRATLDCQSRARMLSSFDYFGDLVYLH